MSLSGGGHKAGPARSIAGGVVQVAVLIAAAGLAWAAGGGQPGRARAVAFAAAVTGMGGLLGWLAGRRTASSPAAAVASGLAATLLRLLPPLAGLAWLTAAGDGLRDAGADRILVVLYLTLLATAVFLEIIGGRFRPQDARTSRGEHGRNPPGV